MNFRAQLCCPSHGSCSLCSTDLCSCERPESCAGSQPFECANGWDWHCSWCRAACSDCAAEDGPDDTEEAVA